MTELADREWRLIREEARPGPMQMALDEVAAETAGSGGPRTVRVYRWEPSTLSLGYNQDESTVDWDVCEQEGITVTRRQTGGGGIYHDSTGDISYSIVAPTAELPGKLMDCYELLCEPIFDAFERMKIDAAFAAEPQPSIYEPSCYLRGINPAHDIVAGGKISGNAQYRQRDAVIQHGSLSYSHATDRHLSVFETDKIGPEQFSERVTSIHEQSGIDRQTAVDALETALGSWSDGREGNWTDEELEQAREIAETKYASEEWNRERVDPL